MYDIVRVLIAAVAVLMFVGGILLLTVSPILATLRNGRREP